MTEPPQDPPEKDCGPTQTEKRRAFHVRKQPASTWAVYWGDVVISTHATRDGAAVSCNQLNRAEGWEL